MNDLLQQLMALGPGVVQGLKGNGHAMQQFLEGYHRTNLLMDQQDRQKKIDDMAVQSQNRQVTRQQEADRIAAEDRARNLELQKLGVMPQLAEMGATGETPDDAKHIIETAIPGLMKAFGQDTMAMGMPAIEMATRTITARQKRQVGEFVEQALKTAHVADNPDADPVIQNLPEHVTKALGKPTAKLSELQAFAQLPVGKPEKPKTKPMSVGGRLVNPDDGSVVYEPPPEPEKPTKQGYRWLVQGDGEPFEWPDNQPAPRGSKPYDAVAARKEPSGQPSAYSVERAARTMQSVDELMSKVSRRTTGIGSMLSGVPESAARNFKAELDTLKANIAFNELTAMREASKTGGALGAVSDREMNLLQSALGSLDQAQSPDQIKSQLLKIKESVMRWQEAQGVKPAPSHTPSSTPAKKNPFRG